MKKILECVGLIIRLVAGIIYSIITVIPLFMLMIVLRIFKKHDIGVQIINKWIHVAGTIMYVEKIPVYEIVK